MQPSEPSAGASSERGAGAGPLSDVRLATQRVLLRPVTVPDASPAYRHLAGKQEILRWLVWGGPAGLAELEERFTSWCGGSEERDGLLGKRGGQDYQLAIVDRESGDLAGAITLRFAGHPGDGDVGYWIASDRWGRGFATDAVRLVSRLAFQELGASVLFAWVFVGNDASRRVLEKCGFALEYTARGRGKKDGRGIDEWYLAQTRWDWERASADFRPELFEVHRRGGV